MSLPHPIHPRPQNCAVYHCVHWLPVPQNIHFKILILTYKAVHDPCIYVCLQLPILHLCNLCSSQDLLLSSPLVCSLHHDLQDFSRASLTLYSTQIVPTIQIFRSSRSPSTRLSTCYTSVSITQLYKQLSPCPYRYPVIFWHGGQLRDWCHYISTKQI